MRAMYNLVLCVCDVQPGSLCMRCTTWFSVYAAGICIQGLGRPLLQQAARLPNLLGQAVPSAPARLPGSPTKGRGTEGGALNWGQCMMDGWGSYIFHQCCQPCQAVPLLPRRSPALPQVDASPGFCKPSLWKRALANKRSLGCFLASPCALEPPKGTLCGLRPCNGLPGTNSASEKLRRFPGRFPGASHSTSGKKKREAAEKRLGSAPLPGCASREQGLLGWLFECFWFVCYTV